MNTSANGVNNFSKHSVKYNGEKQGRVILLLLPPTLRWEGRRGGGEISAQGTDIKTYKNGRGKEEEKKKEKGKIGRKKNSTIFLHTAHT